MAKVAILMPREELVEMALPMVGQYSHITPVCVEYRETSQVVSRARELEEQGAELIIARGVQARMIKHSVKLPVVEMQITTQELGLLMQELHDSLGSVQPRIGLICFANMIGDTSQFGKLFGIDLRHYFVESTEELASCVDRAIREGCQAVVGGNIVCRRARELDFTCRFLPSGVESIANALSMASRVSYAIDQEKRNIAEMDVMLNYTFSGIMQVDQQGRIQRVNRAGYSLLERGAADVLGHRVTEIMPGLTQKVLSDALLHGNEAYALPLDIRGKAAVINIVPIRVDGETKGAILTFQEGKRIIEMDSELRRELYQRGYIAKYSFDELISDSKSTRELIKRAKQVAKYNAPIFITGEAGTGKYILAQCIHRESMFRSNAFISVDCSAWQAEDLDDMLFGGYSAQSSASIAQLAENGTLYLSHVECLPSQTQYKLLSLIQGKFLRNGSNRPGSANVRVIASTDCNLAVRVERGEFRRDLYYALNVLSLELLPLRQRREDILGWTEHYLSQWQEKYRNYVQLTQGARQFITGYDWPGNLYQLNNICQRAVLLAEKRSVDEGFLRRQLEQAAPAMMKGTEKVVLYKDRKAVQITELLSQYGGNREKVARELGVSKTTLWRYMKKYGIEPNYEQ